MIIKSENTTTPIIMTNVLRVSSSGHDVVVAGGFARKLASTSELAVFEAVVVGGEVEVVVVSQLPTS